MFDLIMMTLQIWRLMSLREKLNKCESPEFYIWISLAKWGKMVANEKINSGKTNVLSLVV